MRPRRSSACSLRRAMVSESRWVVGVKPFSSAASDGLGARAGKDSIVMGAPIEGGSKTTSSGIIWMTPAHPMWLDHAAWIMLATSTNVTARMGRRWYSRLTRPIKVGASRALTSVGRVLPERAALAFGRGLAHVAFPLDRRRRATLFKNLELAYGDQLDHRARAALGRKVYEHLGQLAIEIVLLRSRGLQYFADRIDFEVTHPVLEGDRSQLPIIITAHLGNWELGSAALAARGMPLLGVAYALDDGGIGEAAQAIRRSASIDTVPERDAVKALLRGYARGLAPGMLMDLRSHGNPVMAPFFGHDAPTSPGPALLALRTGAPILPMFCARTHGGTRYRMFGGTPIVTDRSRPFRSEVLRITAAINLAIEEAVRAYPDQWYWCYRRWRPRGGDEGGARAWRSARIDASLASEGSIVSDPDPASGEMQAPDS